VDELDTLESHATAAAQLRRQLRDRPREGRPRAARVRGGSSRRARHEESTLGAEASEASEASEAAEAAAAVAAAQASSNETFSWPLHSMVASAHLLFFAIDFNKLIG